MPRVDRQATAAASKKERSMKRTLIATVLGIGILAFGFAADAQKKGGGKGGGAAPSSGYQKVKTYDFSGDTIDGELVKPDGEFVDTRKSAEHTSLIRVRQDFIKEIVKSAENL
jgi:hypothetical protein